MSEDIKNIYFSDERYLIALKRIRDSIANGQSFKIDDNNEIGNKYTLCTWGLCSNLQKHWPDPEDHLWPDQFKEKGRIAPLYFHPHQKCPLDLRTEHDRNGCFYTCRAFQNRSKIISKKEVLELYDEIINQIERNKNVQ